MPRAPRYVKRLRKCRHGAGCRNPILRSDSRGSHGDTKLIMNSCRLFGILNLDRPSNHSGLCGEKISQSYAYRQCCHVRNLQLSNLLRFLQLLLNDLSLAASVTM
jgi:hypothetical protein